MLLAIALAATLQQSFDFYPYGPYDKAVPRPESVIAHGPGEKHTTFHEQERAINAIVAGAPDRVKRIDFGTSTEGRALRILVVSSPNNIRRLPEIQRQIQAIADGKVPPTSAPEVPIVVWFNQGIHGDETASFESTMWLAYNLAASDDKRVTEILEKAVVVINPSYNPDGHERYVVWYNSVSRGDKSGDAVEHTGGFVEGRTNHYRFDLNRDRVAMSQKETQQEVAEFRKWNPQVYVDQHGQVGTYFFPPVAQSIHKDIGRERYIELSTVLGKETAKAFDEQGWRYFVRETFDFYGAIYLDTWSSLNGAIGLTHETDGGRVVRREREDGSVVTLRDGMAKHFTSAFAVLRSAAQNKQKFLQSFAQYKQDAINPAQHAKGRFIAVTGDGRALERFKLVLKNQGIAFSQGNNPTSAVMTPFDDDKPQSVAFGGGAVLIDLAQPRGHLASAMLSPGQDFEPEFTERQMKIREGQKDKEDYPGRDGFEFYDTTGWSIPLAFGLGAYQGDVPPKLTIESTIRSGNSGGKVGWSVQYTDQEDALAIIELLQAGVRVHVATKPMQVSSNVAAGTFFVFRDRNDADIEEKVTEVLNKHGSSSTPLETSFPTEGVVGPGSDSVGSLAKPEIAIVFGDQPGGTRYGSAWYVFEEVFKLPFTAIGQRALSGDLGKYTAIVFPPGARMTTQLKEWVQGGGVLIALGNSAVIGEGNVDLKRSLLKDDKEPTELPGAIFMARLHPRSPLAYGYDTTKPIAVPVSGDTFYKRREEGGGVVLLGDEPKALSGWTWPDETDALKDTVWLHDQPVGGGHIVWFAQDPTSRAMWPGTYKLLLNAVLMGR